MKPSRVFCLSLALIVLGACGQDHADEQRDGQVFVRVSGMVKSLGIS